MTVLTRTLMFLAALLCICAADPKAGEKPDQQRIVGTWQFVSWLEDGKPREIAEGFRLVVTEQAMVLGKKKDKEQDRTGFKYTIDPSKAPKQMDWIIELDPARPIKQLAIYSIDDEVLKICSAGAGKPRPTEFESKKGDFRELWVLRRMLDVRK